MSCCNAKANCDQGRSCPVRAARQGMAVYEPTDASPYRLRDLVWSAVAVLLVAGIIGVLGPTIDYSDEMAQSGALKDAQNTAAAQLRRDLAAAAICREEHGESGYTWTEAGQLDCLPRKGKRVAGL